MSRPAGYRHPAEYTLRAVLSAGPSGRPEFVLRALPSAATASSEAPSATAEAGRTAAATAST